MEIPYTEIKHVNKPWPRIWSKIRIIRYYVDFPYWIVFLALLSWGAWTYGTPHVSLSVFGYQHRYFGLNGIVRVYPSNGTIQWISFKDLIHSKKRAASGI